MKVNVELAIASTMVLVVMVTSHPPRKPIPAVAAQLPASPMMSSGMTYDYPRVALTQGQLNKARALLRVMRQLCPCDCANTCGAYNSTEMPYAVRDRRDDVIVSVVQDEEAGFMQLVPVRTCTMRSDACSIASDHVTDVHDDDEDAKPLKTKPSPSAAAAKLRQPRVCQQRYCWRPLLVYNEDVNMFYIEYYSYNACCECGAPQRETQPACSAAYTRIYF